MLAAGLRQPDWRGRNDWDSQWGAAAVHGDRGRDSDHSDTPRPYRRTATPFRRTPEPHPHKPSAGRQNPTHTNLPPDTRTPTTPTQTHAPLHPSAGRQNPTYTNYTLPPDARTPTYTLPPDARTQNFATAGPEFRNCGTGIKTIMMFSSVESSRRGARWWAGGAESWRTGDLFAGGLGLPRPVPAGEGRGSEKNQTRPHSRSYVESIEEERDDVNIHWFFRSR